MAKAKDEAATEYDMTDLARFQAWFVPLILSYAGSQGYRTAVARAIRATGYPLPRLASIALKVNIPTDVEDVDAYADNIATAFGARIDNIDIEDDVTTD